METRYLHTFFSFFDTGRARERGRATQTWCE